jgi:hypothetical protein
MTRALLYQNNILKNYWLDVILTSTYLINRLSSANLNYKIPLEILYQSKIIIDHLKIFGCTCYVINDNKQNKLNVRAIKTIFLDYSTAFYKEKLECNNQEPSNAFSFFQEPKINEETSQIEQEVENEQVEENSQNNEQLEEIIEEIPLRRSTREIQSSTKLRDFIIY